MLCHDEAIAEEPAEKMWELRAEPDGGAASGDNRVTRNKNRILMGVITGANRSSGLGTEVTTMARGDQGVTISQSEAREGDGDQ